MTKMIDLHGQAGLPYINRGVYTGSYQGNEIQDAQKETDDGKYLETAIYPEPFCFEATEEKEKTFPGTFRLRRKALRRLSHG